MSITRTPKPTAKLPTMLDKGADSLSIFYCFMKQAISPAEVEENI